MYFGNPESYEWYGKRCLLYVRVSTEEQARKGYSLDAQLEELREFAKQYCMKVVGEFIDDGVTARKEVHKRKGLSGLLESVKQDATDYVLFIKLDRWFRSVPEYYRIQEILNAHSVNWKAILEDYDTTTTNGRLNLNIRLSIAQDESDRTGDRIRFVNDNKVKHGGAITGSYPMGLYSHKGKVLVDPQKAEIVRAIFECYITKGSVRPCIDKVLALTGSQIRYNTIKSILRNRLFIGEYRGNPDYCEAIIDKETFEEAQKIIAAKSMTREGRREYIFSGLIRCPECGGTMTSWCQKDYKTGREYLRYRCNHRYRDNACGNTFTPWERKIEKHLLANIRGWMEAYALENKAKIKKADKPKDSTDLIKRRLTRLRTLYVEEIIDLDAYREDYARLTLALKDAEAAQESTPVKNVSKVQDILNSDFEALYSVLSKQEKSLFWTSFIKKIDAYGVDNFRVIFL